MHTGLERHEQLMTGLILSFDVFLTANVVYVLLDVGLLLQCQYITVHNAA